MKYLLKGIAWLVKVIFWLILIIIFNAFQFIWDPIHYIKHFDEVREDNKNLWSDLGSFWRGTDGDNIVGGE